MDDAWSSPMTYKVQVGEAVLNKHVDHMKASTSQMGQEQNIPGPSEHLARLSEPMGCSSSPSINKTSEDKMNTADVAALMQLPPVEDFRLDALDARGGLRSGTCCQYHRRSWRNRTWCKHAPGKKYKSTSQDLKGEECSDWNKVNQVDLIEYEIPDRGCEPVPIREPLSIGVGDLMLRLYRTLVRPLLEYFVQFWLPCYRKDIIKLEGVQKRFT
eukprot:g44593.t1